MQGCWDINENKMNDNYESDLSLFREVNTSSGSDAMVLEERPCNEWDGYNDY